MRSLRCAVTVAAIALGGCTADQGHDAATPSATPTVAQVANCLSEPETRPARITVTCADANLAVSDIAWSSWTSDSALGSGTQHLNTCEPSCASGQQQSTPVTVRLSAPENDRFTRIEINSQDGSAQVYPLPH